MLRRCPSCPSMIPQASPSASREPSQAPAKHSTTQVNKKHRVKTYKKQNNQISCKSAHLHPRTMVRDPKSKVPAQRSMVRSSRGPDQSNEQGQTTGGWLCFQTQRTFGVHRCGRSQCHVDALFAEVSAGTRGVARSSSSRIQATSTHLSTVASLGLASG